MPLTLASDAITFTDSTSLSSGIIGTAQLSAGAVTTEKIADSSVTPQKLSGSIVSNLPSGSVIQTLQVSTTAVTKVGPWTTFSSHRLYTTEVPNISTGVLILSATIVPSSTASKILINHYGWGSGTAASINTVVGSVLYRNTTPVQVSLTFEYNNTLPICPMTGSILDSPGTTSPVTYQLKYSIRDNEDELWVNGDNSGNSMFGNIGKTVLTLQEIKG